MPEKKCLVAEVFTASPEMFFLVSLEPRAKKGRGKTCTKQKQTSSFRCLLREVYDGDRDTLPMVQNHQLVPLGKMLRTGLEVDIVRKQGVRWGGGSTGSTGCVSPHARTGTKWASQFGLSAGAIRRSPL